MKHVFISAGEASGDLHAASLIDRLRSASGDSISFSFLGGDKMSRATGCEPIIHYRQMAFMGFSEVIRHLPTVLSNLRTAKQAISTTRPDAVVLVDYPSFNLKLARHAHSLGIPVFYYIPPKVWAWKEYRVKQLRELSTEIFCLLPFEPEFYSRHGMSRAHYGGNPSVAEIDEALSRVVPRADFNARHELTNRPLLALIPGSRVGEIRNNLPVMTAVAARHRDLQAVVAAAPGIDRSLYRSLTTLPVVDNSTFELLAHSEAALVTSGTASLEAALIGTPQVVLYRANGSRLSYNLFKHILKVNHVSLPNLIVGRTIVPEMLLHHCNPGEVDRELCNILPGAPGRAMQLDGYREMRARLGDGDMATAAASRILSHLG